MRAIAGSKCKPDSICFIMHQIPMGPRERADVPAKSYIRITISLGVNRPGKDGGTRHSEAAAALTVRFRSIAMQGSSKGFP